MNPTEGKLTEAPADLKPCPFCGGVDIEFTSGEDSDLWAYCQDCHAGVSAGESNMTPEGLEEDSNGLNGLDRVQCFEAWNTRTDTRLESLSAPAHLSSEAVGKALGAGRNVCSAVESLLGDLDMGQDDAQYVREQIQAFRDVEPLALLTPSPSEKEKP